MNFKKHLQSIIIVFIIFFNACAEGEWELIEAEYEPELIVFGLISLDPEVDSFVHVYRSLSLSEKAEIFAQVDSFLYDGVVYRDSIYGPAGLIKNAQVSVTTNGISTPFDFVPRQNYWSPEANFYIDTIGTFKPQPSTTYFLDVTVPGYNPVKGELLTPEIPVLIDSLIQDTISVKRNYKIVWKKINEGKGILTGRIGEVKYSEVSGNFLGCDPDFDRVVNLQDGIYTVPTKICEDRELEIIEPLPFKIGLTTIDENYYKYFIRGEEGGYSNFLLGAGTTGGRSVGIYGGLGVFCSIATTQLDVILDD